MQHIIIVILIGWLVSFLGQLPLGTMSLTSTQIAVEENLKNAWKYALGVALVEIVYLRLVLIGTNWVTEHQLFYEIFGWAAVAMFLVFSVLSFISAIKHKEGDKPLLLKNKVNRFFLGISMSAVNVAQIPFWFIWSTYVVDLKGMNRTTIDYNFFTLGCGIGTISGLALYMYGGKAIIDKVKNGARILSIIMAIVFIIAAIVQAYRMIYGNTLK
jgi:threonine/homoserine/homoserine lactone efflux protein